MAGQRALQGRRRSRERTQLGEDRPRALRQRVERRAPVDQELLDDGADRAVGRAGRRGRDGDDAPAALVCAVDDLAAERRLPDARRAAHEQRRRPAARDGPQLPGGVGELDLATDEHPLAETNARGAPVIQRPCLGIGLRAKLPDQRDPQALVPADRDVPLTRVDRCPHQLPARGLVRRLDLHEPLPVRAATQQLREAGVDLSPRLLGPCLVQGVGQQLARALGGGSRASRRRRVRAARAPRREGSARRRWSPCERETARHAPSAARSTPGRPTSAGHGGPPCAGWPHRPRRRGAATAARRPDRAEAGGRRQGRAARRAPAPDAPANRPR